MEIILLRHGATQGNLEKRYIGRTDEPLSMEGVLQAQALLSQLPYPTRIFTSPYLRCRQTVELAFGRLDYYCVQDLREFDFGRFEGHTADELAGDAEYRQWVDGDCQGPCPGGDNQEAFSRRCCEAFASIIQQYADCPRMAFVLHGGSIMAIMERFARPKQSFYSYHLGNCQYYICRVETADGQICLTREGEG
ncbi:MAG: histidine phosphatase family protein [Firmicutes bacterium]|nr:histidine phosphatase family protein [Bacillota bacterium]